YRFLAELSDVRQAAQGGETHEETVKALERVLRFVETFQGDALLKEREPDLWQTLTSLANELTDLAEREKAPGLLSIARRAWSEAKKYPPPTGAKKRDLEAEWPRIEQQLAKHVERQQVVAVLKKQIASPTALGVKEA